MQLDNEDNDFKKAILKKLQDGLDIPQIMKEVTFHAEMVCVSYVCGDRVTASNRIVRK